MIWTLFVFEKKYVKILGHRCGSHHKKFKQKYFLRPGSADTESSMKRLKSYYKKLTHSQTISWSIIMMVLRTCVETASELLFLIFRRIFTRIWSCPWLVSRGLYKNIPFLLHIYFPISTILLKIFFLTSIIIKIIK